MVDLIINGKNIITLTLNLSLLSVTDKWRVRKTIPLMLNFPILSTSLSPQLFTPTKQDFIICKSSVCIALSLPHKTIDLDTNEWTINLSLTDLRHTLITVNNKISFMLGELAKIWIYVWCNKAWEKKKTQLNHRIWKTSAPSRLVKAMHHNQISTRNNINTQILKIWMNIVSLFWNP